MAKNKWMELFNPRSAWSLVRRGAEADAELGSMIPGGTLIRGKNGVLVGVPNRAAKLANEAEELLKGEFKTYDKLIADTAQELIDTGVVRGSMAAKRADDMVDSWLNNSLNLKNTRYTAAEQKKIMEIIEQRLGKIKHYPQITHGRGGAAARAQMIADARQQAIDNDLLLKVYNKNPVLGRVYGGGVLALEGGGAALGAGYGGYKAYKALSGDDDAAGQTDAGKSTDIKDTKKPADPKKKDQKKSAKFNWKNAGIYGGVGGVAAALAAYAMSERKNRLRNMLIAGSITGGIGAGIGGYSEEA